MPDVSVVTTAPPWDPTPLRAASLTPEVILAMMERRLQDMDRQIVECSQTIENSTRRADEVAGTLADRRALQQDLERIPLDDDGRFDWGRVPTGVDGPALRSRLETLGLGDTPGAVQASIDGLNESLRRVNSGNEMLMVQLQSAMQERTSVIQMGSNMLKSLHEGTSAIVGNLR